MNNKAQLQALTQSLINLGEDREELDFWLKIFDDLEEDRQHKLIALLEEELKELKAVK